MAEIGYVVVEYNQASGAPGLPTGTDLHFDQDDADREAECLRKEAAAVGRRERYRVCELVPVEDDES